MPTLALSFRGRVSACGKRQTDLRPKAWEESGKVHGQRKLVDDLLDQGEMCCPHRVAV